MKSLSLLATLSFLAGLLAGGVSLAADTLREGGELGNAFVPFESKIGGYSLEYDKKWRFNDLSVTASFVDIPAGAAQGSSFLSVTSLQDSSLGGLAALREKLEREQPGARLEEAKLAGLEGLRASKDGVSSLYLLRAAGDLLVLRFRSTGGERTDMVIGHMLSTFRAD